MPSKLFYSTQSNLASRELASTLGSTFKKNVRVENGVYLGRNRILVGGQEYQFQNTGGQTIETGASIAVQNIGRKAAAIYAPTDLPTGLAVSGSSDSTTTTATLSVHTHADTESGGNTLTVVTSGWNFLLENVTASVQTALSRLDSRGMMAKRSIDSGDTLTVPSNYSMVVIGPYSVVGTLTMQGIMRIL